MTMNCGNPRKVTHFLTHCTFVVFDEKGIQSQDEKGIQSQTGRKTKHLQVEPGWRNWQTQRTQNPPGFGPWGLNSPSLHQLLSLYRTMLYEASWFRGAD